MTHSRGSQSRKKVNFFTQKNLLFFTSKKIVSVDDFYGFTRGLKVEKNRHVEKRFFRRKKPFLEKRAFQN